MAKKIGNIELAWDDQKSFDKNLIDCLTLYILAREKADKPGHARGFYSNRNLKYAKNLLQMMEDKTTDRYAKFEQFHEITGKIKRSFRGKSKLVDIFDFTKQQSFKELLEYTKQTERLAGEYAQRMASQQALARIRALEQEINQWQDKVQAAEQKANVYLNAQSQFGDTIEHMGENKKILDELVRDYAEQMEKAEKRIAELEAEVVAAKAPENQPQEIQLLKRDLIRAKLDLQKVERQLEPRILEVVRLQETVKKQKKGFQVTHDLMRDLEQQKEDKEIALVALQEALTLKADENQALLREKNRLQEQLAETHQQKVTSDLTSDQLGAQLGQSYLEIDRLQRHVSELQRQQRPQPVHQEVTYYKRLKEQQDNALLQSDKANQQVRQELLRAQQQLKQQQQQNRELQEQLADVRKDYQEVKKEASMFKQFVRMICKMPGLNSVFKQFKAKRPDDAKPVEKLIGENFDELPSVDPRIEQSQIDFDSASNNCGYSNGSSSVRKLVELSSLFDNETPRQLGCGDQEISDLTAIPAPAAILS